MQFFPTAEGYVNHSEGNYNYVYNHTDHLGNVRVSYAKDPISGLSKIVEESNYYPFGLKHANYNDYAPPAPGMANMGYQYKYNEQELQTELGLNMTAMDYRQYDNAIGRFNSIDALSELGMSMTPYQFGNNNPVSFSDPTGLIANGDPFLNSIWNHSSDYGWTNWNNDGYGLFTSESASSATGLAGVDFATGMYFDNLLNPVQLTKGDNIYWAGIIEQHVYDNGGAYKGINLSKINDVLNGYGFSSSIKEILIDGAVAINRGVSVSKINNVSYLRALGKGGATYMKYVKGIGVAGSVITTGYSANQTFNQYQNGGMKEVLKHRDFVDTGVGIVGLGTTGLVALGLVSNPVGWGIGIGILVYGGATLIYDAYY